MAADFPTLMGAAAELAPPPPRNANSSNGEYFELKISKEKVFDIIQNWLINPNTNEEEEMDHPYKQMHY